MKSTSRSKSQDALSLLIDDHKKVQKLFKEFAKLAKKEDDEAKTELAREICTELTVHAQIEEEILYPAARQALDDQGLLDEAQVEHESAKDLIAQIESMQAGDELFDAKVTVLGEYVNHHIKEEQDELFAKLKKTELDLDAMGEELQQRKAELMDEAGMEEMSKTKSASQRGKAKSTRHAPASAQRH